MRFYPFKLSLRGQLGNLLTALRSVMTQFGEETCLCRGAGANVRVRARVCLALARRKGNYAEIGKWLSEL